MRIRKQATFDGVWTLFVGDHLCISDLSEAEADALAAAFASISDGGD